MLIPHSSKGLQFNKLFWNVPFAEVLEWMVLRPARDRAAEALPLTLAEFVDLLFGYGTLPCMLLQCTFGQVVARQGSSAGILLRDTVSFAA